MSTQDAKITQCIDEMWRVYYRIDAAYNEFAKCNGETYSSLLVLCELGERGSGMTQRELVDAIILPKQTVGSVLSGLERRELVSSEIDTADRRRRVFTLTEAGQVYWKRLDDEMARMELAAVADVELADMQTMLRVFSTFADGFAEEVGKL